VHFGLCVVDGVFEAFAGPAQPVEAAAQANPGPAPQSVSIIAATGLDDAVLRQVQAMSVNASCAPLWCAATLSPVTPRLHALDVHRHTKVVNVLALGQPCRLAGDFAGERKSATKQYL